MQHPVARIVCNKLDVARLRHTHEHRVSRSPCRLGLAASFSPRNYELVSMKVDRMVVHSQIDKADAHALPVPHDEGSVGWTRLSVEGKPVELHVHGVRHLDVRQDGVLLHNDCEVFIDARLVWLLGMHDERADHAHHFLHRHVRVVEISAFLVQGEFIDEATTGSDRILTRTGRSVHLVRDFEAVPVHRCGFGKMVVHDDPNAITLVHLNRWSWSAAVVTPEVDDPARKDLLFDRLGGEMEFLYVSVHAPRKLRNVGRFDGKDPTAGALGRVAHVLHVHARSAFLRGCKQVGRGSQTSAQTKTISQEITSVFHGSSSSRIGGPKQSLRNSTDIGSKRDAWPSNRREVAAVAIWSPGEERETQMRRMKKDAACAGGLRGGPLSKPQASVQLTARNAVIVPRTTTLRRTTVT